MTQHLYHRPRRLRRTDALRRLVSEHTLSAADFIYPVFVIPGSNKRESVASMPGVERLSLDLLFAKAEQCLALGVPVMALFPVIETDCRPEASFRAASSEASEIPACRGERPADRSQLPECGREQRTRRRRRVPKKPRRGQA